MVPRARVGRGDGPRELPRVGWGLGCPWYRQTHGSQKQDTTTTRKYENMTAIMMSSTLMAALSMGTTCGG